MSTTQGPPFSLAAARRLCDELESAKRAWKAGRDVREVVEAIPDAWCGRSDDRLLDALCVLREELAPEEYREPGYCTQCGAQCEECSPWDPDIGDAFDDAIRAAVDALGVAERAALTESAGGRRERERG